MKVIPCSALIQHDPIKHQI